jgi:hypothetical protein
MELPVGMTLTFFSLLTLLCCIKLSFTCKSIFLSFSWTIYIFFVVKYDNLISNSIKYIHLTLYTFSFEINESRLSDTRCLIQDVVSPHCGDKRMARRCTRRSLPNYVDITSYHWNVRQNTVTWRWWMNGKNNVTSYTQF